MQDVNGKDSPRAWVGAKAPSRGEGRGLSDLSVGRGGANNAYALLTPPSPRPATLLPSRHQKTHRSSARPKTTP